VLSQTFPAKGFNGAVSDAFQDPEEPVTPVGPCGPTGPIETSTQ
jgi:hypothetical protein